jgi:hypothetical protein
MSAVRAVYGRRRTRLSERNPFMRLPIVALALLAIGCAHSEATLDLERVVLYRNGVGYFERHGNVDDDVLRIKVRRDQVDDLLKSLTVIDENGQAVSVSMPLDPQSWATAALAALEPGQGSLAEVLDGLRGTEVTLQTTVGRIRGRVVMVERIVNEPDPTERERVATTVPEGDKTPQVDHRVTLVQGGQMRVVRLSKVRGVTLRDGDVALQLNRRLDASAGEGMFQQIEVAIRLAGAKKHKVVVSYVVEAPMWKPTYRVVLPEAGKKGALLQGWAVVDNVSGEDWDGVTMSLTSGEPIAFRYDLHTPRAIDRADLTETGVRRQARVAVGETTYEYEDLPETEEEAPSPEKSAEATAVAEAEPMAADEMKDYDGDREMAKKPSSATRASKNKRKGGAMGGAGRGTGTVDSGGDDYAEGGEGERYDSPAAPPPPPADPSVDLEALRRSTAASARAKTVSGMTRFDLGSRVTVPNGSSTMVAILNEQVEAEETFLYRPGGAGSGYEQNPYRVVRFKNTSQFVLEPGPIAIYSGGSFVGEGLSEAVGTNTSATIPFAVEPTILVTQKADYKGDEMRLIRIVRGVLEVEAFSRTETVCTARGPAQPEGFKVIVRHPKAGWNYEITERPAGTEDLADAYLVPINVAPRKAEGSVKVVEQTPSRTTISIWDGRAVELLEQLIVATDVTAEMRAKLEPIVKLRQEIGRIDTQLDGLRRKQGELDYLAEETRQNLEAIKKDPAAGALRKKLNARLDEFGSESAKIARELSELQTQRLDKKIELDDMLRDIDLTAPGADKPKAKAKAKDEPPK